jgi:hypothetical protein
MNVTQALQYCTPTCINLHQPRLRYLYAFHMGVENVMRSLGQASS